MTSLPIRSSRVCSRSEFLLLRGDERSAELNWRGQLVGLDLVVTGVEGPRGACRGAYNDMSCSFPCRPHWGTFALADCWARTAALRPKWVPEPCSQMAYWP